MKSDHETIKDIYEKEISLFRELLRCVNMERENLIHLDLNSLWSVIEEKQKIFESIEEIRIERKALTGNSVAFNALPQEDKRKLMNLSSKLSVLQGEIKSRVAENMSYINESLDFFHEIFSIFTNSVESEEPYSPLGKNRVFQPSIIYRNEV